MDSWSEACDQLVQAFRAKDNKKIDELIAQIQDPNAYHIDRDSEHSLLFHASLEESDYGVKALLNKGADPLFCNDNGTTVITPMVKKGQYGMIRDCVQKINDETQVRDWVNETSQSGWTPLMAAANGRDQRIVQLLLKCKADPNQQMTTGWTAMHTAAKIGNVGAFQALLKAGGDPTLLANHREFGNNLTCHDVTTNQSIIRLYEKFEDEKQKNKQ